MQLDLFSIEDINTKNACIKGIFASNMFARGFYIRNVSSIKKVYIKVFCVNST